MWQSKDPEIHNCANELPSVLMTLLLLLNIGCSDLYFVLNLVFSTQARLCCSIIMMAQNRQSERDTQAQTDYQTNVDAKLEIDRHQY
jgi:hypothetical protein